MEARTRTVEPRPYHLARVCPSVFPSEVVWRAGALRREDARARLGLTEGWSARSA